MKKILIIGTGLMGGSIAKAVRKKRLPFSVWGLSRGKEKAKKIRRKKIFSWVTADLKEGLKDAWLVIIATPVFSIVEYIKEIAPFLEESTVVTDTGSTKKQIVREGRKRLKEEFVGSHPICGIEKAGIRYSNPDFFQGAVCVVTPQSRGVNYKRVKDFWVSLGCRVICLSAEEHDKVLSYTSGLPHVLSFAFTKALPLKYSEYTSGSFRDLSRVSASGGNMWAEIFLSNKKHILRSSRRFIRELERLLALIKGSKQRDLRSYLKEVNKKFSNLSK